MDRNYGRGAARRIFWRGILNRNYEGFIRFFCGHQCSRRQLNAFWQTTWPQQFQHHESQQFPESQYHGSTRLSYLDLTIHRIYSCSFFRIHFWTPTMSLPTAFYFWGSFFGPQLWSPILCFLLIYFEICTCIKASLLCLHHRRRNACWLCPTTRLRASRDRCSWSTAHCDACCEDFVRR